MEIFLKNVELNGNDDNFFKNGFKWENIPKFAVITGLNGSGKTKLLQSILKKNDANNRNSNNIIFPQNLASFRSVIQSNHSETMINTLYHRLTGRKINGSHLSNLSNFINENELRNDIREEYNNLNEMNRDEIIEIIRKKYLSYFYTNQFNDYICYVISSYIWSIIISEINQTINITEKEDIKKTRAVPPWEKINEILSKYNFKIKMSVDIEKIKKDMVNNFRDIHLNGTNTSTTSGTRYEVNFINEHNDVIDYNDLSSGEQIIISVALMEYNKSLKNTKLLLLDEPDAYLHPSISKILISVVKDILIDEYKLQVIMTTHKPSTISYCEDENILYMKKENGKVTIEEKDRSKAINDLSEGIMTLEKGIRIFDEIFKKDITIISEGKNFQHIKKAISILGNDLLDRVQLYDDHFDGVGKNDLYSLFEFIKATKVEKKVLFVWDCDAKKDLYKKEETEHVFKFCFAKNNDNNIAVGGIENLYSEDLFTEDLLKVGTLKECGKDIEVREFSDKAKNRFLDKILNNNDKETFKNFQPLVKRIKELLGDTTQSN